MKESLLFLVLISLFVSCKKDKNTEINPGDIIIDSVLVNDKSVLNNGTVINADYNNIIINIWFNKRVDTTQFNNSRLSFTGSIGTSYKYRFTNFPRSLLTITAKSLEPLKSYSVYFDAGQNLGGLLKNGFNFAFTTIPNPVPKFPQISDDSLLTLVEKQTFRYFWDYAHPISGLSRERYGSGDLVTIGGTGFSLMAILVGIERHFITRQEGFERVRKIIHFLSKKSTDKYHGVFPHWLSGSTGKVIPFSQKDDGGDLVETGFLVQGLICAGEYFKNGSKDETAIYDSINNIRSNIDWNWYRKNNENHLYWHWSPDFQWTMNMPVTGWNEALIVYVLAASSTSVTQARTIYDEGWARNGAYPMKNGKTFFGIQLPLGPDYGGPLFFAHYSFLGLDPRQLSDQYADYWVQNTAHSRINYEYCITNPKYFAGYGDNCWGLTASDTENGYSASSPTNDLGVIAPTAAVSSFPYTPYESMRALKFFYYTLGDKLWGYYGFYDAFSLTSLWFAKSYLAIDQGPIICMIENYRTGFLWDLFMSNADVKNGLDKLGFTYN